MIVVSVYNLGNKPAEEKGAPTSRAMGLGVGSHRSFATDGPLNVSSSVCREEASNAERSTLRQRNQKFIGPIIERDSEWALKNGKP